MYNAIHGDPNYTQLLVLIPTGSKHPDRNRYPKILSGVYVDGIAVLLHQHQ